MTSIRKAIQNYFRPINKIGEGIYYYQSPANASAPYRLHLRVEPDGNGLLIINASTILHLNPSATELAYHIVKDSSIDEAARKVSSRFRVSKSHAARDFRELKDRIQILINTHDLDPEMFLNFTRISPASRPLTAPYRLDCALTYRLPEGLEHSYAPMKQVDHELSTSEWFCILDKAWEAGIPHVVFTGGEPTLRQDLMDICMHSEDNGQVSGLISDGLIFADPKYLDRLLQTGLDYIMITLLPENPISWCALDNLINADIFLAVHQTLTLQNALEVGDTIYRLAEKGIKSISLSTNDISMHNNLNDLRNLAASLNLSMIWDLPVPYSAFNPVSLETQEDCSAQENFRNNLYVEPDGDVLPTQGVNLVLGNLLSDPWDEIWQNRK